MKSIIVGTAGHIDHGKSSLVYALSGKDPDRLPEEKRRGITIDLGFADLDLGQVRVGFVDVPGHERFVRNMLAGAHGIDLVALVIAADEGVMPQTREHFDICRLLGVRGGLIVITKIDLVESELLPLVQGEAEELVAGSFLEGAPVVPVSTKTLAGIDELKETLEQLALDVPDRAFGLVTMLPIDRAFTMKGFGPVVTGTLISGEIAEGQELELLPLAMKVRARGLQVHGKPVKRAFAGQRTAANLGGVDAAAIERGMVLAPVGRLHPAQILDAELEMLPGAPYALRSRARVRFHLHTVEVLGRVRVLSETGEIAPGAKGFVQIRLEAPVIAHAGERFILRSYSPSLTIAGGRILNPAALKHRGKELARVRQTLTNLSNGNLALQLSTFVTQAKDQGLRLSDLAALTGWTDAVISEGLKEALRENNVVDCEGVLISQEDFNRLSNLVKQEVQAHHKREPLSRGLARETLRERNFAHAPAEVFRVVLTRLEREGVIVSDKDVVREKGHSLELAGADADLRDRLDRTFREAGLAPGSIDATLRAAAGEKSDVNRNRRILQMLIDEGKIVRIQPDMIFHRQALNGLIAKLRDYASKHEPDRTIDVAGFKDLAGISRKYAIPLLGYMDRERITRRSGDRREILHPGEERK